jgi:hypothetical protein
MAKTLSTGVNVLVITIAAIVCLTAAAASLKWRYEHDSSLMIYAGFLVANGKVPYRDFFDMNMPGTYFAMVLVGRAFGWSDAGIRVFDLLCLATIAVSTFLWMRRFGKLPAFVAAIVFPLWYLYKGPELSIQREYLALVPLSVMLTVTTTRNTDNAVLRTLFVGLLAGITVLIKPQFLLLSLPLLVLLLDHDANAVSVRRRIIAFVAGVLLPIGAAFLYLLRTGGLSQFVDIAVNYWPLYTHMTTWHEPISGLRRDLYIVRSSLRELLTFHAPMAILGLIVLDADRTLRRHAAMLAGLLVATAIYPAVSGQFWDYHWIPFQYVALCVASLALRVLPIRTWSIRRIAPVVGVFVLLLSLSLDSLDHVRSRKWDRAPDSGVPDEIGQFLLSHLNSGDTVQPLDWTGGAVHGMLMARAPLATRFMYDFHFYHHISSPYVRRLRREFVDELRAKTPRYIIQVFDKRPWPTGTDTTREFPELQTFLEQDYATVQQGTTYRILEKNGYAQRRAARNARPSCASL